MELVYLLIVALHFVGMAMLVGGWLTMVRSPKVTPGMWHGALTQLVTGLALVGLASADVVTRDVDHTKIGVKLVVALAVAVAVAMARRGGQDQRTLFHVIGGLSLLNVLVAVLWR